ncbi:hypothetical protein PENTCL1PPCAC_30863 [Pristionchus entomophagus]|uniref:Uncharacterized protein n=1 Tax=Pristionchus entomophagus TaxID=358040 RepID=A0AAV5UNT2_9BILA|nr:hypothetical protein PENTCL1PPCAC_30863 [Pristionchus entomophagus]
MRSCGGGREGLKRKNDELKSKDKELQRKDTELKWKTKLLILIQENMASVKEKMTAKFRQYKEVATHLLGSLQVDLTKRITALNRRKRQHEQEEDSGNAASKKPCTDDALPRQELTSHDVTPVIGRASEVQGGSSTSVHRENDLYTWIPAVEDWEELSSRIQRILIME